MDILHYSILAFNEFANMKYTKKQTINSTCVFRKTLHCKLVLQNVLILQYSVFLNDTYILLVAKAMLFAIVKLNNDD